MAHSTPDLSLDTDEANRIAGQLSEAAQRLANRRRDVLHRMVNGTAEAPVRKIRHDMVVNIGAAEYSHPGTTAGELLTDRMRDCTEAFTATEEGIRALSTVMARMIRSLEDGDSVTAAELQPLLADLHCVARVVDGRPDTPDDWFGTEASV